MEERLPPSDADAAAATHERLLPAPNTDPAAAETKLQLPLPLPPGHAALETYVVQIPRDNVCRVPPPEHARIMEEHARKFAAKKPEAKRRRRRFRCSLALPIVLVVVLAAVAIVAARATFFRPSPPALTVTRIRAENLNNLAAAKNSSAARRLPEFKIAVRAENRNPWMSISYGGGGAATLSFKDKTVGQGKIPASINANDDGAADFTVVLSGKGVAALPKAIKDKLTGDEEKFMELTLDLAVEMTSLLRNEKMKLQIYCDFRVRNSLMKNAKISWQECGMGL